MVNVFSWFRGYIFIASGISSFAFSQTTPTELAEMSLQELFEQSIDEPSTDKFDEKRWSFALQYKAAKFDGYLDGDSELSFDDVLWSGPEEPRTEKNFPVLPTVIRQRVTLFSLAYEFNDNWIGHVTLPYIYQSTDHISSVENYDNFTLDSSGVGDTIVSASYRLFASEQDLWWLTVGLSLPTGSIDERGDTPRAAGDQQLPYTMQLGSGTYDFPVELSYQSIGLYDYSLNFSANFRTGRNDRNYRLGNNYNLSGRYRLPLFYGLKPFIGLELQYSDDIHGQDESLLVPAEFAYPAGITNPTLYGGKKVTTRFGVSWKLAPSSQITLDLSKPVYQNLNGPQPKEVWRWGVQLSKAL